MDEIIKHSSSVFSSPINLPQFIYPITEKGTETFMVVIKLPPVTFDEIIVSIDSSYIEVAAQLLENDPLLSLINEANSAQVYTTKVRLPNGLNIENADASYNNGAVTVYLPYA